MDMKSKLIIAGAAALAGFAVNKALEPTWKLVTGNTPPQMEEDSITQLVVFAALSAALATVAQTVVTRKTTKFIESRFN